MLAQQSGRPVADPQMRWWVAAVSERGGHHLELIHHGRSARPGQVAKSVDSPGGIAVAPANHRWPSRPGPAGDLRVRQAFR
jgi:hypothetical protein